jgi:hypothetical protein
LGGRGGRGRVGEEGGVDDFVVEADDLARAMAGGERVIDDVLVGVDGDE